MKRIPGLGRLRRGAKRLKNKIFPGAPILLYHRVAEVESDPWSLSVTPQHFAEQLEVLRKLGHAVQLQQLTQDLEAGKNLRRKVAIAFDDGYADNFLNAKPLLERYDIPATVFVSSGYVGRTREFWWDELERVFLQPGILPQKLELNINGSTHQWDLGKVASYNEDSYQWHSDWQVKKQPPPTPRHALYYSLWQLLRPLQEGDRLQILDRLLAWAGIEPESRPTHRPLSFAQVSALEQGLIEVGAHTVTHPLLSALPLKLQQEEIQQSKAHLEELLGHQVSSFAYPYGDYTAETIDVVRSSGFACACSTIPESVRRHSDRFLLPRVQVQNWGGEEFARWLSRWFNN